MAKVKEGLPKRFNMVPCGSSEISSQAQELRLQLPNSIKSNVFGTILWVLWNHSLGSIGGIVAKDSKTVAVICSDPVQRITHLLACK